VRLSRLPIPDIVVQILLGIIVGPQVFGWARINEPVRVLSLIGLSFLLFLAGLKLDIDRLQGRTLRTAASSVGIVIPILSDSGEVDTPLGCFVMAGGSLTEVIPVLLLSLLFSERASGLASLITLLAAFCALVTAAALLIFGL
jgi:Kef-type K+ transport system membrane component KefB